MAMQSLIVHERAAVVERLTVTVAFAFARAAGVLV